MVLAAVLRFHDPGRQWLTHDEVHTALRTAGHTAAEIHRQASVSGWLRAEQLQRYLDFSAPHGWPDAWRTLLQHPEHPPLYFLLARFVRDAGAEAMVSVRQFSALWSVLALPAVFWLALELSGGVGSYALLAAATLVVSPLQVLHAQDARPYSLLFLLTVLAAAAYLRLRRRPGPGTGCTYGLSVLAGLYTSLLFIPVLLSQGIDAWLMHHPEGHRRRWTVAAAVASLAFLPWGWLLFSRQEALFRHTAWLREGSHSLATWNRRTLSWSASFLDLGPPSSVGWWPLLVLLLLAGLALVGGVVLARRFPERGWSMPVLLLVLNPAALLLADLLLGGRHGQVSRYLIPATAALHVLVAAGLWWLLVSASGRLWGLALLLSLVLGGAVSCGAILRAETWWTRHAASPPSELHHFLQAYPGSTLQVVRSPTSLGQVLALSERLDRDTRIEFLGLPGAGDSGQPLGAALSGRLVHANQLGQVVLPAAPGAP